MKRWMKLCSLLFIVAGLLWVGAEGVFSPYEAIPYVPSTGVEVSVSSEVEYDPDTREFIYSYVFKSGAGSSQNTATFEVATQADVHGISHVEFEWSGMVISPPPGDLTTVVWNAGTVEAMPAPGSTRLMSFRSGGVPGIASTYTRGDVPPPDGRQFIDSGVERPSWPDDSVQVKSIGPDPRPSLPLDGPAFLERLIGLAAEANSLAWISDSATHNAIANSLGKAQQELQEENFGAARDTIEAILIFLDAERGNSIDNNAYYLCRANLEFLLDEALRPAGEFLVQVAALSKHVKPHKNEQVKIEVTPSSRANLEFSVFRVADRKLPNSLGNKVFSQTVTRVPGVFVFIWNGQTSDGGFAENGDYDIVVDANDGFGSIAKETVSVQVNRQGAGGRQ